MTAKLRSKKSKATKKKVKLTPELVAQNEQAMVSAERSLISDPLAIGNMLDVLCLGDKVRGPNAMETLENGFGMTAPPSAFVRAVKITRREKAGAIAEGTDADGRVYAFRKLKDGGTERVKVTSATWSVCHIVWDVEVGRLIIEAAHERRRRWRDSVKEMQALAARISLIKRRCWVELEDVAQEVENLRFNKGKSNLVEIFSKPIKMLDSLEIKSSKKHLTIED